MIGKFFCFIQTPSPNQSRKVLEENNYSSNTAPMYISIVICCGSLPNMFLAGSRLVLEHDTSRHSKDVCSGDPFLHPNSTWPPVRFAKSLRLEHSPRYPRAMCALIVIVAGLWEAICTDLELFESETKRSQVVFCFPMFVDMWVWVKLNHQELDRRF